jgi:hypothetical protein
MAAYPVAEEKACGHIRYNPTRWCMDCLHCTPYHPVKLFSGSQEGTCGIGLNDQASIAGGGDKFGYSHRSLV